MNSKQVSVKRIFGQPCPNGHMSCLLPDCWVNNPIAARGGEASNMVSDMLTHAPAEPVTLPKPVGRPKKKKGQHDNLSHLR